MRGNHQSRWNAANYTPPADTLRTPHRCAACWTPLYPYEVTPPGGPTLTITTCPVCDRWREGDDR